MFRTIMLIFSISLLSGCAAPITKEGYQVREIQHDWATTCKFIGIVEVSGGLIYSSLPEAKHDMLNKLRNETARLGGNAFATNDRVVEKGFSEPFAQADAYKCP